MKLDKKYVLLNIQFIFLTILAITQLIGLANFNIIISGIILIIFLIANVEQETIMIFEILPFFNLLNKQIGGTSYYYVIPIIYIIKYIKFKRFKIKKQKLLCLLAFSILRAFCGNLVIWLKWFMLFCVLIITYDEDIFVLNFRDIVKYFTILFLISSIFGNIMLKTGKSIYTGGYVYNNGKITSRFAGLIGDPVFYSQISAILISVNLVIIYDENKIKLSQIICIMLLIYFTVLSYSKTGIILEIISIVIFYFEYFKINIFKKRTLLKGLIIFLIGILVFYVALIYIKNNSDNLIISNMVTRLDSDDLMTGRNKIFTHYIDLIIKKIPYSLFWGLSDAEYAEPFSIGNGGVFNRSHNIYIETMAIFGVIPTLIIIISIGLIFKNYIKYNTKKWFNLLPMLLLLISGVTLHGHYEFHYYFLVAICLASCSLKINKK